MTDPSSEGEGDESSVADKLVLSPNGRFLHAAGRVVPLDGAAPFPLLDRLVQSQFCSPDGNWIAFIDRAGLHVIPIAANDGKASGPARKLSDTTALGEEQRLAWTRDSLRVVFLDPQGWMRAVSVREGTASEWTDIGREPWQGAVGSNIDIRQFV